MDALINLLLAGDILLAILLVVVCMARMDQRYAQRVRAEAERKSILRGERHDER